MVGEVLVEQRHCFVDDNRKDGVCDRDNIEKKGREMKIYEKLSVYLIGLILIIIGWMLVNEMMKRVIEARVSERMRIYEQEKVKWEADFKMMMAEIERRKAEIEKKNKEIMEIKSGVKKLEENILKERGESEILRIELRRMKGEVEDVLRENPKVRELVDGLEEELRRADERELKYQEVIKGLKEIDKKREEMVASLSGEVVLWRQAYERERGLRVAAEEINKEILKTKELDKIWGVIGKGAVIGVIIYGGIRILGGR